MLFKNPTDLKKNMMHKALSYMTGYQTDIVYDFEYVDEITRYGENNSVMFWGMRKTGTWLHDLDYIQSMEVEKSDLDAYFQKWFKITVNGFDCEIEEFTGKTFNS